MLDPSTQANGPIWAIVAGLIASFFAAVGVSEAAFAVSAAGVFVGGGFAPKMGRLRAILLFPCSAILAAKGGLVMAALIPIQGLEVGQLYGGLIGVVFHPLIASLARSVPEKFGIKLGQGTKQ